MLLGLHFGYIIVHTVSIVTFEFCQFFFLFPPVIEVYQVVGKGQNVAQTDVAMADEFAKISDKHVLKF